MVNRKVIAASLLIVSLMGGALGLANTIMQANKQNPDLQEMLGAPKTAMQLNLFAANKDAKTGKSASGLEIGYDYFDRDGKKIRSRLNYQTGAYEDVYFRADTTKERSVDYYPAAEGERAILRSNAWFSADGKTYTAHDVYRIDGKFERRGKLLADGNYELTFFCENGVTMQKQQLFGKTKSFISEKAIFCENGQPIRSVEEGEYSSKVLKLFRQDGSLASKQVQQDSGEFGYMYTGEVYDEKGEVIILFDRGSFRKMVTTVNGGTPDMEFIDNHYQHYGREISKLDKSDPKKKVWTQQHKLLESYDFSKGTIFTGVTEFGADGKIVRSIEMNEKGDKPARVIIPTNDASKQIVHHLNDNGKIVKTVLRDTKEKTEEAQKLPKDLDPKIPAEMLKAYDAPSSPEWDDGNTSTGTKVYDYH